MVRRKPRSAEVFREAISQPEDCLEERAVERLKEGHGARWRQVVANWGHAWLALYEMDGDLYTGRLGEIGVSTLVLHGLEDPHTDLEEIQALADQAPARGCISSPRRGTAPTASAGVGMRATGGWGSFFRRAPESMLKKCLCPDL